MSSNANTGFIRPADGDPQIGNLETPINSSAFSKAFLNNLPAYRKGLSPLLRGLEIGLAHGYFISGPWVKFGPLRDSDVANLGGLISGVALILIATAALAAYGIVSFQKDTQTSGTDLQSSHGWSQFTAGFFIGGTGGAYVAYSILENLDVIKGILSGSFNS
jgi:photosystem I subunit 11